MVEGVEGEGEKREGEYNSVGLFLSREKGGRRKQQVNSNKQKNATQNEEGGKERKKER